MTYLIIDTNIWLHFTFMDEYPWQSHNECDNHITLVVTHPLIEELDKKKYSGKNHLKQRAIKALKLIDQHRNSVLKNGCNLYLFNENIKREYIESLGLDIFDDDDRMLAALLKYKEDIGHENVWLVSNDLGPRLKAGKFQVDCIIPNDEYLLKSPDDELEKSIKLLKLENEKLKNQTPKLSVTFENGDTLAKYKISERNEDKSEFVNSELLKIQGKYKRYKLKNEREEEFKKLKSKESNSNFSDMLCQMLIDSKEPNFEKNIGINEKQKEEYNMELANFYNEYEIYLNDLYKSNLRKELTIEINLKLLNTGTVPAEDIDVFFHFPDGFVLLDEESYFEEPSAPHPPHHPRSPFDFSLPRVPMINTPTDFANISTVKANVSSPSIKKTNSYNVDIHVVKLKHNTSVILDKMFVVFENFESIINFNVDYELRCSNFPNIVSGKLNFVIETKDSI